MYALRRILIGYFAVSGMVVLVTGCHNSIPSSLNTTPLLIEQQKASLRSLFAATQYLREQCNRRDLPDEQQLTLRMEQVARANKWDQGVYPNWSKDAHHLYLSLLSDATPKNKMCAEFSISLHDFLMALNT
ncbi:TPA: type II secretion system pilot lipoprotein GspS [Kluyvera ascorbata]|nr:type II secretion system pilot lipoprotein GspS [Kluyvera ascorbata]